MPDETERKRLVLDYFERVNAGDVDAPGARVEDPVGTGPVEGAEAIRAYFQRVVEEFGTQDTPGTLTGSQDDQHVAAGLRATIRNPQDPAGGRLAVNATSVFRFDANGLIEDMRAYWGGDRRGTRRRRLTPEVHAAAVMLGARPRVSRPHLIPESCPWLGQGHAWIVVRTDQFFAWLGQRKAKTPTFRATGPLHRGPGRKGVARGSGGCDGGGTAVPWPARGQVLRHRGIRMRTYENVAPIAVVGMACRLPGAAGPGAFWDLLGAGRDAVGPAPAGRWSHQGGGGAGRPERAGYLERVDTFDAEFFGISPREAAAMDPHQRLMLELCWEATEHSRTHPDRLRAGRTGVFTAAMWDEYAHLTLGHGTVDPYAFAGAQRGVLAGRVSYAMGLTGPSLGVDTGQSSSLVAVHLACENLRRGESTVALLGGVNLIVAPGTTAGARAMGALSATGRCRPFDAGADGYVRGEGGAVVVLKPLATARADGDVVHGLLLGSAVNNDGGGDSLTAPRRAAQEEVLRLAHERAGTDPARVQYVELHGTGTVVGDPVEAAALGAVHGAGRPPGDPLRVGSAKNNVGHLEAAAGLVGLVKTVLSLRHRELPPSPHFTREHPDIPLARLGLRVQAERGPWPHPERPLLAGVSAFGMGGTNCHVVLAQPPGAEPEPGAEDGPEGSAVHRPEHDAARARPTRRKRRARRARRARR